MIASTMISLSILIITSTIGLSISTIDERYRTCSNTHYSCGNVTGVGYPFWGGNRPSSCGIPDFHVFCSDEKSPIIYSHDTLPTNTDLLFGTFTLLNVNKSATRMTIASRYLWDSICPRSEENIYRETWPTTSRFSYVQTNRIINIFYGCKSEVIDEVQVKSNVRCPRSDGDGVFFADRYVSAVKGCGMRLGVAILPGVYDRLWDGELTLHQAVREGFEVDYGGAVTACLICESSGGNCGTDSDSDDFVCLCPDGPRPSVCLNPGMKRTWQKAIIGVGASAVAMTILLPVIIFYFRGIYISSFKLISSSPTKDDQSLEEFIRQHGPLSVRRYNYSDIRKMTNSFQEKLGQGGFGGVYKGKIGDRFVAVKFLNKSEGDGEEFMNEVASISRTSHINIVTLLGFCLEGQRRALVYEFMSNGSLDKFIYNENASETNDRHLGWEKLHQISLDIAQGLEYLHRGCNTRILHLDIKPHNILLDEDFCPKISDFGLAKLCSHKESIVSMLGTRGTIGYIAPEVASRSFGKVSYKSDVFSYGMMILEMVAGRKNVNNRVSHTSKIYFPRWVYRRLTQHEDIGIRTVSTEDEEEIARKMVLVGLWCTQADPSQRPSMSNVIDMLERNDSYDLESGIPPKPYLCSSSKSELNLSFMSSSYTSPRTEGTETDSWPLCFNCRMSCTHNWWQKFGVLKLF